MQTPLSRRNSAPSLVAPRLPAAGTAAETTPPATPARRPRADTPGLGVLSVHGTSPSSRRPVAAPAADRPREGKHGQQAPRKAQAAGRVMPSHRQQGSESNVASLLAPALRRRNSVAGLPDGDRSQPAPGAAGWQGSSEAPAFAALRTWRQRQVPVLGKMLALTPPPGQVSGPAAALPRNALREDPDSLLPGLLAPYRRLLRTHGLPVPGEPRPDPAPTGSSAGQGELLALIAFLTHEIGALEGARARGLPEPMARLHRRWAEGLEPLLDQARMALALRAARSPGLGSPPPAGPATDTVGEPAAAAAGRAPVAGAPGRVPDAGASGRVLVAGARLEVARVRPADHGQSLG